MAQLKVSTAYTRLFFMVSSTDHLAAKTGLTCAVVISKAGAAFASAAGTVTEIANGWYKVALTTADSNTLGDLAYHITSTGADDTDFVDQVSSNILGDTLPANVTQIAGAAVNTAAAQLGVNVVSNADKTGYALSQAFPANFSAFAITAAGKVTVGTNDDKTGYSLTQTFPTNFASLAVTAGGAVTAGTVSDKTGYTLTQSFPTNFAATLISVGGAVTVGTNSDKTGYVLTQDFPDNFDLLAITAAGKTTVGTNDDKTGYALTQSFPAGFSALAITDGAVTAGTVSDKTGYALTQAFPANFAAAAITAGGAVTAGTVSDKTGYSLAQAFPSNFASLSINAGGSVKVDSNVKKNQALAKFGFLMTDSTTHLPKTTLTVTVTRSIDGGVFDAGTLSVVTEISGGIYTVDFAAADLNGNCVVLRCTATGADQRDVTIITYP